MIQIPFDKTIFQKAMPYALGCSLFGFIIIWIGWGEITALDGIMMFITTVFTAYLIHVFMLARQNELF